MRKIGKQRVSDELMILDKKKLILEKIKKIIANVRGVHLISETRNFLLSFTLFGKIPDTNQ